MNLDRLVEMISSFSATESLPGKATTRCGCGGAAGGAETH